MIIEITGPSGVGKSTYLGELRQSLERRGFVPGIIQSSKENKIKTIPDVFSDLDRQNIRTDLASIPWFLLVCFKNFRFFAFLVRRLIKMNGILTDKVSIMRSLIRKIGIYGFLSQRKYRNCVILVDEGIFHIAHNLLVSPTECASSDCVREFVKLCPPPDGLIIMLDTPEQLAKNQIKRGNFSPRIKSEQDVFTFANNAYLLFLEVAKSCNLSKHALILEYNRGKQDGHALKGSAFVISLLN